MEHLDTILIHGNQTEDSRENAKGSGYTIDRSASYNLGTSQHAKNLYSLKESGFMNSRFNNKTCETLEHLIAKLSGGKDAVVTSSGMAAIYSVIMTLVRSGDEIVSASNIFGRTYNLFDVLLKDHSITVNFADARNPKTFASAISQMTRFIYVETIGNSTLDVSNIKELADIAHKNKIPLIVDATYTPFTNYNPIKDGADIVIHSLTKWIGGHGAAVGGVVIDAGQFDWKTSNVPLMKVQDPNYNGFRWTFDLPKELSSIAFLVRLRMVIQRTLGSCLSSDNAWIILQGMQTLSVRMERHNSNALSVAKYLEQNKHIAWIRYPGLEEDPCYELSKKMFDGKFGGMIVFGLKTENEKSIAEKCSTFIDSLKLIEHTGLVGSTQSTALHASSTVYNNFSEEKLKTVNLSPELIRLSVGIECVDDIIADLDQAIEKAALI